MHVQGCLGSSELQVRDVSSAHVVFANLHGSCPLLPRGHNTTHCVTQAELAAQLWPQSGLLGFTRVTPPCCLQHAEVTTVGGVARCLAHQRQAMQQQGCWHHTHMHVHSSTLSCQASAVPATAPSHHHAPGATEAAGQLPVMLQQHAAVLLTRRLHTSLLTSSPLLYGLTAAAPSEHSSSGGQGTDHRWCAMGGKSCWRTMSPGHHLCCPCAC